MIGTLNSSNEQSRGVLSLFIVIGMNDSITTTLWSPHIYGSTISKSSGALPLRGIKWLAQ
jgi:hypothetical protein